MVDTASNLDRATLNVRLLSRGLTKLYQIDVKPPDDSRREIRELQSRCEVILQMLDDERERSAETHLQVKQELARTTGELQQALGELQAERAKSHKWQTRYETTDDERARLEKKARQPQIPA